MTRNKIKYSMFCEKKPAHPALKKEICVFLQSEKQWVICKGKIYLNGRCRYWHNGIEGIVNLFSYKQLDGYNEEQINELIINLNLRQLNFQHPLKKAVFDPLYDPLQEIVATAEETTASIVPIISEAEQLIVEAERLIVEAEETTAITTSITDEERTNREIN